MSTAQNICILGATGSIGVSTLKVIEQHPERYRVFSMSGNRNIERLKSQILQFKPAHVALATPTNAADLNDWLSVQSIDCELHVGESGLAHIASLPEVDQVVSAIVGAAGLLPTLAAIQAAKRVLLANKESLVLAGNLMMDAAQASGATILPVDSEHNAIFQCLAETKDKAGLVEAGVERLILTASGGPFFETPLSELAEVTVEQACDHPCWSMGQKISIDSATMMNKGLEVIEAYWLFGLPVEQIEVVIHPQSIVHSMVAYQDGSVMAQLGLPDMMTPIGYCLAWPERLALDLPKMDFSQAMQLQFLPPDLSKFKNLALAFDALKQGGVMPATLNAANEVSVDRFMANEIGFLDIAEINAQVMAQTQVADITSLDDALNADARARALAEQIISQRVISA
ncbi:MAG: 1-deoxy-D-xylulose-5-phosphate reductoisomerase [Pseudomonadota bacterium]|nr:1-deoxy-D-xylulose-5-phosphate reductoisomerase [Pseudomonadota bacterium]